MGNHKREKKDFMGKLNDAHTQAHTKYNDTNFISANCLLLTTNDYRLSFHFISFNMVHTRSECLIIFRCGYHWWWLMCFCYCCCCHHFLIPDLVLFFFFVFIVSKRYCFELILVCVCVCFPFVSFCSLYIRRIFIAIRSS